MIANIFTGIRIVISAALIFFRPFSVPFYVLYITGGITDMIDGPIARKTGTAGDSGAIFDTAADFIFFAVCLIKPIPALGIPKWIFIWIAVIFVIKITNIISGLFMYKKLISPHTVMNKITGLLLFILPIAARFIDIVEIGAAVCAVATFAAIQEGHYIRTRRNIN